MPPDPLLLSTGFLDPQCHRHFVIVKQEPVLRVGVGELVTQEGHPILMMMMMMMMMNHEGIDVANPSYPHETNQEQTTHE